MLMNLKEAAAYLGITVAALQKWCQRKQVPYYKLVGQLKFRKPDLDRFIDRHFVPAIPRMKDFKPRSIKKAK